MLRIEFLRFASNLPPTRLDELISVLPALWNQGGLRLRKHLVSLLARLAYRLPAAVHQMTQDLGISAYVFSAENQKDELSGFFIELLGNLWLSPAEVAAAITPLLADALCTVLKRPVRLANAAQIAAILSMGRPTMRAAVLDLCGPAHSGRKLATGETVIDSFMRGYCQLWARRWRDEGRLGEELIDAASDSEGATRVIHLLSLNEWMVLCAAQDELDLLQTCEAVNACMARLHEPVELMEWSYYVLGPLLLKCQKQPLLHDYARGVLQEKLRTGLEALRGDHGMLPIGLAIRLLVQTELSPAWVAAIFAGPIDPTTVEWTNTNELRPFLLMAGVGGITNAARAQAQDRARLRADKAFLSSMQTQVLRAFQASGTLTEPETFLYMVSLSGDARKLTLVASALRRLAEQSQQFAEALRLVISNMLSSPSQRARSSIVLELPALIVAALYPRPSAELGFTLLLRETDPKIRAHLAVWMARELCTTAG